MGSLLFLRCRESDLSMTTGGRSFVVHSERRGESDWGFLEDIRLNRIDKAEQIASNGVAASKVSKCIISGQLIMRLQIIEVRLRREISFLSRCRLFSSSHIKITR